MDKSSPLYKKLKKELISEKANNARILAEYTQSNKDIQAIEHLLRENSSDKQPELNLPIDEKIYPKQTRQRGVSDTIRKTIGELQANFMMKDLKKALASKGLSYPVSTLSATVRKMVFEGALDEGAKVGKERTYLKGK